MSSNYLIFFQRTVKKMQRTESISVSGDPFIKLNAWQLHICDGNHCEALILSYLLGWHWSKLANAESNKILNKKVGKKIRSEETYQWHTAIELQNGILGLCKTRKISDAINNLEKREFITIFQNPMIKTDRTKFFKINTKKIKLEVNKYKNI